MNLKKISITFCMIFALVAGMLTVNAASSDIKVTLDGKILSLDSKIIIENNQAYVPVAEIMDAIGGTSTYNSAKKQLTVVTADKTINMYTSSKTVVVNNSSVKLNLAVKYANNTTYAPISFFSQIIGAEANFSNNTVTINYFTIMKGTLKIGGSTTVQPISQAAADKLMAMSKGLSISVTGGGSGAGIKGVMSGEFNIGNASRELTASEIASNKDIKDFTIGTDGIVVIVNPKNTVNNLSKKQVYDIFTGKIKNWKDVGGKNAPIFVQTREPASGTLTAFVELALQKVNSTTKDVISSATPHTSNGLMKDAVAKNENSIGFLSMGFLDNSTKAVNIENIKPTLANAMTKKWPYVRPLNIVTKGRPTGITAMYINYILSPEGQEIVAKENYLQLRMKD